MSKLITKNDLKAIFDEVLPSSIEETIDDVKDPTSRFDISSHTIPVGSVSASGYIADQTITFTKAGYFPIAISGWNMNVSALNPTQLDLNQRSVGSCTVRWSVRNVTATATSSANLYVRIFWLKIKS